MKWMVWVLASVRANLEVLPSCSVEDQLEELRISLEAAHDVNVHLSKEVERSVAWQVCGVVWLCDAVSWSALVQMLERRRRRGAETLLGAPRIIFIL